MPITLDCPSGPVAGPVKTATDGAHGFSPSSAFKNAHEDAHSEAYDLVADEINANYQCRAGCRISMGPKTPVSHRQLGPPYRAWWTLGILFWADVEATGTRFVQCVPIPEED